MHKNRVAALIKKLKKNNIDALFVAKPENVFYLTSVPPGKIALLISHKKIVVITDFIYAETVSKFLSNCEIHVVKDDFAKAIAAVVKKYKIKKVGFESLFLNFRSYKKIKGALKGAKFIAVEGIVESLREIKEKKEVAALKKALKITTETLVGLKKRLRPEATELSLSRYIRETFIKKGADGCSFEPIVATQPFSSQPHHIAGEKRLGHDKGVLIDMGARLMGYNSDLTRMYFLGKMNSKFITVYNVLLDAQKYAIDHIMPGARISDIDFAARQYIDKKGFGKFFGHALGHGVGLEIHENPSISRSNSGFLKEGMVLTIEPGIYIPGFGGLRIEDMFYVNKNGCEVLSNDIDKTI